MNYYLIILGLVTLGGLMTTVWGLLGWQRTRRVANWPKTNGMIELSTAQSADDDLLPEIVYRYEVEGVQYSRDITLPSGTLPSQELAKRLLRDYPVGKSVVVNYDPKDQGTSLVEGTLGNGGDLFIILFGVASAIFGVVAILQGV